MDYIKAQHAETERGGELKAEFQVSPGDFEFEGMLHVAVHDDDSGEMVVGTELSRDEARALWQAIGYWLDSE